MINASIFCGPGFSEHKLYNEPITKLELLALAIAAQRINNTYLKRGGEMGFVDKIDQGVPVSRYERVKQSNRFVMETVQQVNPHIITEELLKEANEMMINLEMDYMFKVLGDSLNDFETSIQQFLADDVEIEPRMHIGVVAYIPAYVEREVNTIAINERSMSSAYIGIKGDKVTAEIEIISKRQATQWDGWNINAITSDGNRVSFFTTKDELSEMTGVFSITAKVKDCSTVWGNSDIKETRLNYVKIL
jgi:hypothetical protein